ncbi:MAG TPA: PEP/pyruvate-binding domain-containing protein, partial [Gemmatimonadales bacterium]
MAHQPPLTQGVIPLRELTRSDRRVVGAKAAALGELARAGFPVPEGFVVLGEPDEAVLQAAAALGDVPLAVRSSAVAEDLAEASFAGQYDTVLDVRGGEALLHAVRQVRASAGGARVRRYRDARGAAGDTGIAVLVQRMLTPEAAGVAFTANPVTGARDEVVVTAARGLGERVVSGEAVGDEWVVRGGSADRRRVTEHAIDAEQALAVARLARSVEALFGAPQDIEWAIEGDRLYLLQSRPMTALPEPVDWTPPSPGYWMRNFRLGEWLPEPMTPLFQDWLLPRIEEGYLNGMRQAAGAAVPWRYAAIHGWYYTAAPNPGAIPAILLRALVESRGRVVPFLLNALVRVNTRPEAADRAVLQGLARHWREDLLPRYQRLVAAGERRVETAAGADLAGLIDEIGIAAGECLWSLAVVGGSAWKMEGCLARFLRRHVPPEVLGSVQVLLRGLPGVDLSVPSHAVQSLDWYRPTAGELGWVRSEAVPDERRRQLAAERETVEAACRQALADRPPLLARFESLLEVAQRYAVLREEQAHWFTLGWPLLRRCALRLGETLRAGGMVDGAEDVFFLTRAELPAARPLQDVIRRRRAEWERRRRLAAPLAIGRARLVERTLSSVATAVRSTGEVPEGAIVGQPASPGRAAGPVRIIHGPEDFDRFRQG